MVILLFLNSFQTLTTNHLTILWIFRYCSVEGKGGGLVSFPNFPLALTCIVLLLQPVNNMYRKC